MIQKLTRKFPTEIPPTSLFISKSALFRLSANFVDTKNTFKATNKLLLCEAATHKSNKSLMRRFSTLSLQKHLKKPK